MWSNSLFSLYRLAIVTVAISLSFAGCKNDKRPQKRTLHIWKLGVSTLVKTGGTACRTKGKGSAHTPDSPLPPHTICQKDPVNADLHARPDPKNPGKMIRESNFRRALQPGGQAVDISLRYGGHGDGAKLVELIARTSKFDCEPKKMWRWLGKRYGKSYTEAGNWFYWETSDTFVAAHVPDSGPCEVRLILPTAQDRVKVARDKGKTALAPKAPASK